MQMTREMGTGATADTEGPLLLPFPKKMLASAVQIANSIVQRRADKVVRIGLLSNLIANY